MTNARSHPSRIFKTPKATAMPTPREELQTFQERQRHILRFALRGSVAAGLLAYPLLIAAKWLWGEIAWMQIGLAPPIVVGGFNAMLWWTCRLDARAFERRRNRGSKDAEANPIGRDELQT